MAKKDSCLVLRSDVEPFTKPLKKRIKELEALRDKVQINCNPPDDCNDPVVLKTYMKACFEEAMKL